MNFRRMTTDTLTNSLMRNGLFTHTVLMNADADFVQLVQHLVVCACLVKNLLIECY